ncbi:MAG: DUF4942 domain-containing protein [Planctomycetaceae bacterium]|jgi:hypothetical protein|nr:DUF4942 domain-containing protein [Planctomycetaceae bacterium]
MLDNEFYPTPKDLAHRMAAMVNRDGRDTTVLEPSAGKGDLIKALYNYKSLDIDAIEIDSDLRGILKADKIRVVHDDFLTFNTLKRYNYILMNPPFSCGDKHLTKALSLLVPGGKCICLLNVATLDNTYSHLRKTVKQQLEEWGAEIETIPGAFKDAERKTDVDVSLICVTRPEEENPINLILDSLKREVAEEFKGIDSFQENTLIDSDPIKAAVTRCYLEQKVGLQLLQEYRFLKKFITEVRASEYTLQDGDVFNISVTPNEYIRMIRKKYWEVLFHLPEFNKQMTTKLISKLDSEINRFSEYDFSEYNILALRSELSQKIVQDVEGEIIELFDECSRKYHWSECSKNIHYFNGWKTNESWKVNKKVVLPFSSRLYYGGYSSYDVCSKLRDIERVFAFLDSGQRDYQDIYNIVEYAFRQKQTRNIRLKYVTIDLYKKGTMHIKFNDEDLLQRFNIFGCLHKKWLPPSYGKKSYDELDSNEKAVIDSFEGEQSYRDVCSRSDLLFEVSKLPLLCGSICN